MIRVLDRVQHFDPKSKAFGISRVAPPRVEKRVWTPPVYRVDQGQEGHCVGFGWANELASSPVRTGGNTDAFAHGLFYSAQAIDRAEGRYYDDGATVLAGAKAVKAAGYMDEYRWAFSIEEIKHGLLTEGPCVIGIEWLEGMYSTRPSGLMEVEGNSVGGHCLALLGYHPGMRIAGEGWLARHEVFIGLNSWGPSYAKKGVFYVKVEDVANKLMSGGEFCFPIHRKKVAA